jgi:hypothetical protein
VIEIITRTARTRTIPTKPINVLANNVVSSVKCSANGLKEANHWNLPVARHIDRSLYGTNLLVVPRSAKSGILAEFRRACKQISWLALTR